MNQRSQRTLALLWPRAGHRTAAKRDLRLQRPQRVVIIQMSDTHPSHVCCHPFRQLCVKSMYRRTDDTFTWPGALMPAKTQIGFQKWSAADIELRTTSVCSENTENLWSKISKGLEPRLESENIGIFPDQSKDSTKKLVGEIRSRNLSNFFCLRYHLSLWSTHFP